MPIQILDWGVQVIMALQTMPDALINFFRAATVLGDEEFYLLFLPLLYWTVDNRLRLRVGIFFALSVVLNTLLKTGLHSPRPFWTTSHVALLTRPSNSFGLPSGHAQHAVIVWGTLAAFLGGAWWIPAALLMLAVGFSRIVLGVHFPTDVLAGWLVGALLLMVMLRSEEPVLRRFQRLSTSAQMFALWLLGLAIIALGAAFVAFVDAVWIMPLSWIEIAALQAPEEMLIPLSPVDFITITATVWSLLAGHVWLAARGGFSSGGPIWQRATRFLLGVVGVVLLWAGVDIIFSALVPDETALGYALRYVRYSIVGAWVGLVAPLIFLRLGLAKRERATHEYGVRTAA